MNPAQHQSHGRLAAVFIVTGILVGAVVVQSSLFRSVKSVTFDETFYAVCARQSMYDGKIDERLALSGVAPLPIVIAFPAAAAGAGMDREDPWIADPGDVEVVRRARWWNSILIGAPLVLVVFFWLYRRRGIVAASLGGALTAFSPSVLAHASLATTDLCFCLFAILALAAMDGYFARKSWGRFLLLATAAAACLSAKYSGLFLAPTLGVLFLVDEFRRAHAPWWKRCVTSGLHTAGKLLLFGLIAGPMVWAFHLFSFAGPLKTVPVDQTPDSSPWVRLLGKGPLATQIMRRAHTQWKRPAPAAGIWAQVMHQDSGHVAYLMGEHGSHGWWYYFPVAIAAKSTPAEYVVMLAAVVIALIGVFWRRFRLDRTSGVWGVGAGVFFAMAITSSVNIGHRHILLLYPLAILIGVDGLARWLNQPRAVLSLRLSASVVLVVVQIVSAAMIAPHYLAYFSPLFGGPSQGRRYLVDSNLDWGQDLPLLAKKLQQNKYKRVLLAYFGSTSPKAYGINAERFDESTFDNPHTYDAIAISATLLQGAYTDEKDPFAAFRQLQPVDWAGYSIAVFELQGDQAQAALLQAIVRENEKRRHPSSAGGTGES